MKALSNKSTRAVNTHSGVPQDSHIGPVVFLLFMNEGGYTFKHSIVLLYADDFKLYRNVENYIQNSLL